MLRMLLSRSVPRTTAFMRPLSSGRITVKGPAPPAPSKREIAASKQLLIKTNLEQHFQYLKSQRLDPNAPPPSDIPHESGLVGRDLTDDMISVADMYDPRIHLPNAPNWASGNYEEATPLSQEMVAYMAVRGQPMTVADFMRQALTHEQFGYYTNPTKMENDDDNWDDAVIDDIEEDAVAADLVIGRQGDFVTAPEVSQVFGECLAVWFVTQFNETLTSKQKQAGIQLVEVGPGKGTLIQDVLRSCCLLSSNLQSAMQQVHLVEASPAMRQEQMRKLKELVLEDPMIQIVFDTQDGGDEKKNGETEEPAAAADESTTKPNKIITVRWHATFSNFVAATADNGLATFVVCQEFIDALPVHVFEKTADGWRERMIDVAIQEDEEEKKEEEAKETAASAAPDTKEPKKEEKKTRLRIVVSPNVSPACQTLLNVNEETGQMEHDDPSPVGTVCEVCPEGILLVQDIRQLLERNGGAALLIDYGNDDGATDSLRGYSRHEQVNFLSKPGQVDVTADVDFQALRHAVNAYRSSKDVDSNKSTHFAFGPVTQGNFLTSMGAVERVISLIEDDNTTDEQAEDLYSALERLVMPEQMGERYKVMAIGPKKDGIFAPPGFL
jgi:NADH dehydrogenase [ubiquinone] 1 alpha subcomplex assembly factor 7